MKFASRSGNTSAFPVVRCAPFNTARPGVTKPKTDGRTSRPPTRSSVSAGPALSVVIRPDGSVAQPNAAVCKYFGLTAKELTGRPFTTLVKDGDAARVQSNIASLSPVNRATVSEARAAKDDDGAGWVRWTHLALFDVTERLIEIHSFGQDITHQRQVEEDAAYLAALVAGADDAIISKTLEGIVTSWNPAAETMFGFSAADAIGRSIALIIPQERLHEEAEILARLKRGERTEHFQTERLRKDGRRIAISVNVSPVQDSAGAVIGASKIARDVTEQRRAQDRLQASMRSLEALYRLSDQVARAHDRREVSNTAVEAIATALGTERASVLLFDSSGVMRFIAWRGLSEHYRAAMEGHSPWTPDSRDALPILIGDVQADESMAGLREEIEREGIRALGFFPLVYQERVVGKFMVYFDRPRTWATEERRLAEAIGRHVSFGLARVEAEATAAEALQQARAARHEADGARAEAEQASRAKDEFLAMLAHELRNPMGVIVHAATILSAHATLPAEERRAVGMIERQSQHLASLLDDLLDVARITSGHIELETERLDLGAVVNASIEAQRLRIAAKSQQITVSIPPQPVNVIGDAVRLQQVIGNLVNNASKYTPAGGSIWVALRSEGDEALLDVRDTGAGIPADSLNSIFDLFVQANPTLARTEGGLGVGLTLVKRVVELHKGHVESRSEGLGKGAQFAVRLPLARLQETVCVQNPPASKLSAKRILIVEDHDDGREALAMLLRLSGHEVYEAASGRAGLDLAKEVQPEVVLLDIGLPDLDGYAVAEAVRAALGRRVHIVALTGYGQPADRARSAQAGFDAHLVKPVDADALMETLAALAVQ
jgi:PAS domain S-box-containing protein